MLVGNNLHLTYCANVHPGETWNEAFAQLKEHLPKIKREVSPKNIFGVGMYLSDNASTEILVRENLKEFKAWLAQEGLYVFTMNGFPFGGFHADNVKDKVYHPDWTKKDRVEFTKRLFTILAELLPAGMEGGISTAPVSYKYWFNEHERDEVFKSASKNISEVAFFLNELSSKTGKLLHLDIEPEPDCLLENSNEAILFFNKHLFPINKEIIQRHINLCYDICHFSVEYENQTGAINQIISNGIRIGKIQISAALKALLPNEKSKREVIISQFRKFDETRYFHQTVKRNQSGRLKAFRDLSFALNEDEGDDQEWRTHFHVPLFLSNYGDLQSTQDDVLEVLRLLKKNQTTNHLEVETYTWDVLPADMKTTLTSSIIRELEWVKKNLAE